MEKVIREYLKLLLYALLIKDNLVIKREEKPKSGKIQIVTSFFEDSNEPKKFYEIEVKKLIFKEIVGSKEEIDNLQWGDIFNILTHHENKIKSTILKYLDPDLRNNIAHGKAEMIFEEDMNYIKYYTKEGEKTIDFFEFLEKTNKMFDLEKILHISLINGLGKYLLEKAKNSE